MTAAKQLTHNLVAAYKLSVQIKKDQAQQLKSLIKQNPSYKIFDFAHPLYTMNANAIAAEKQLKATIKAVIDEPIGNSTVRTELDQIILIAQLSNKPLDDVVQKLRKL